MIQFHHLLLFTHMTQSSPYAQNATFHRAVNMRVDSDVVRINELLTDRLGRTITGARLQIPAVGGRQGASSRICVIEQAPVSMGLILDTSGSMGG
jgi:hypothetical protein